MTKLQLSSVSFSYASGGVVVDDFSLEVEPGEMIALLGASGCGKTTILRLIAGLLEPSHGPISFDGLAVNGTPAERRGAAMVFQKPLLFPHLSVAENVGFGLTMKGASEAEKRRQVREALALVKLDGFESRRPSQLSGGQEQRVAIARALVSQPKVLLLDEPFTALDENLRVEVRSLVRQIQRKLRITTVFVTHDRHEAAAMAHRIAFLHQGRIQQIGSLRDFFERPSTLDTARFFGFQIMRSETAAAAFGYRATPESESEISVCVRPSNIGIAKDTTSPIIVETSLDLGDRVATIARLPSGEIVEVHHSLPAFAPGDTVCLNVSPGCLRIFDCP